VTWALEKPSRVQFGPESPRDPESILTVDALALKADEQRLFVDAKVRGQSVAARLELSSLALAKPPRAAVDASYGLGGRVGATVSVTGTKKNPVVDATVTLENGKVMELTGLGLSLKAALKRAAPSSCSALPMPALNSGSCSMCQQQDAATSAGSSPAASARNPRRAMRVKLATACSARARLGSIAPAPPCNSTSGPACSINTCFMRRFRKVGRDGTL
jgi:hypothetical protein